MVRITTLEFIETPGVDRNKCLCIEGHKRMQWPEMFRAKMSWSDGNWSVCDLVFGGKGASRMCMVVAQGEPYCFKFCDKSYQENPNKTEIDSYESLPSDFTVRVFGYIDYVEVFGLAVSVLVVERVPILANRWKEIVCRPCTHEDACHVIKYIVQTIRFMCKAAGKYELHLSDWHLGNIGFCGVGKSEEMVLVDWERTAVCKNSTKYQRMKRAWDTFCNDLDHQIVSLSDPTWKDVLFKMLYHLKESWWRSGYFSPDVPSEGDVRELWSILQTSIIELPKLEQARKKLKKTSMSTERDHRIEVFFSFFLACSNLGSSIIDICKVLHSSRTFPSDGTSGEK